MSTSLKHYGWSAFNRFGVQLIGFIGNILIARQLTPDDYGLVAMLAIFMGIAWNFTESGFADCLIRKQDADKKDFATIFIHNILFGIFLYGVLFFSAPYIAQFFERNELVEITRLLGLSIIIKAITVTEFTRMRKELMFKNTSIIQIVSSLLSVFIAYLMALNGFGYWAIVMQILSIAIINLIMIVFINNWRPYFYFSWSRYIVMRGFGNNMLLAYFTNQIGNNLYSLFIGKFQTTAGLGFYNQGIKINDASFQGINAIILTTSYPLLAKEKDVIKRKKMYEVILNHFLFIQFAVSFLIIGAAYPIMEIVFGQKWIPTAPYLQLLTLSFLFFPLSTLNANIIKIEGKSALYRNLTFLRNGLNLFALLITYKYSIETIIIGQIVARYISVVTDVLICGNTIDFKPLEQLKITMKQLIAPFVAIVIAYFSSIAIAQIFLSLVVYSIVFIAVLSLTNRFTKNEIQDYYFDKIKSLIRK